VVSFRPCARPEVYVSHALAQSHGSSLGVQCEYAVSAVSVISYPDQSCLSVRLSWAKPVFCLCLDSNFGDGYFVFFSLRSSESFFAVRTFSIFGLPRPKGLVGSQGHLGGVLGPCCTDALFHDVYHSSSGTPSVSKVIFLEITSWNSL
jgi:hypothetical protein